MPQYRMGQRELLTLMSAIMALMALGIDTMLPAFDEIRKAFNLGDSSPRAGQVITVFFMGLAIAQLVWGPIADRFGRKPVLYAGSIIYVIGAVGSALAPTFELLLLSRFVWGLGAAGARVVATAIIRDRFEGSQMAKAMSQVMAVFMLVPILAPSIGAGLIAIFPWRSIFWFCAVFALAIGLWSLRMRESLDPGNRRPLELRATADGYVEVARTPVTSGYTNATIFLQGVFTTYLASSELIISEVFDREDQFPLIFGLVALLFAAGAVLNGRIVVRVGVHRLCEHGLLNADTDNDAAVRYLDLRRRTTKYLGLHASARPHAVFVHVLDAKPQHRRARPRRPSCRNSVGLRRSDSDGGRRRPRHDRQRFRQRFHDAVLDWYISAVP